MKALLCIALGAFVSAFVGIVFGFAWRHLKVGTRPEDAPWSDLESPFVGAVCFAVGLFIWPFVIYWLHKRTRSKAGNQSSD